MLTLKRNRGCNFSHEEEYCFVQILHKYRHKLESKKTKLNKDIIWNEILVAFNEKCRPRTLEQLKSKYDHLKIAAKKYAIDTKVSPTRQQNQVFELILDIITPKTNAGSRVSITSDSVSYKENLHGNISENIPPLIKINESDESDEVHCNVITRSEAELINSLEGKHLLFEIPKDSENCSDYSSTSNKKKSTSRSSYFTPFSKAIQKNKLEYYNKKMALLDIEMLSIKSRLIREEEFHKLQMKNLQLEILMKERQICSR